MESIGALLDKVLVYFDFCSFYSGRRVSSLDSLTSVGVKIRGGAAISI